MAHTPIRFEVKLALSITLLFALAMWVYYGTTSNFFVWDTPLYLRPNESYFSSINLQNLKWMATSLEAENWHPLTWFSWAIDYQLYGGLVPWGYHFSNNLIHAINGLAVFALILTFLGLVAPVSEKFTLRKDSPSLVAAFLVSLLFVVHPQHVESVAWVAERKDLLCQLFLLLSLLAYVKYVNSDQARKPSWYLITLGLYFLAVLSKPMAVTFPVVLMLVDVYPLRRTGLQKPTVNSIHQQTVFSLVVEKLPFMLLSLVLVLATLFAQQHAMGDLPLTWKVVNAVNSIVLYLEKFMLPFQFSPHYPLFLVMDDRSALRALFVFSALLGVTLTALLAWRKQQRGWMIAWLFYLITLSPVLGLIQVGSQGAADRYAYFPTLPLYLILASGIFSMLRTANIFKKSLLLISVIAVIFLLTLQTRKQISIWNNEISLWTHAVKLHPENTFSRNNLGTAYMNFGDYENAAVQFEASSEAASGKAIYFDTGNAKLLVMRSLAYMHLGRYEKAINDLINLDKISDRDPGKKSSTSCIQYNIGWNYAQLGQYQDAIDSFNKIDHKSTSGSDAHVWLNELGNFKQPGDEKVLIKELPGFCENLM